MKRIMFFIVTIMIFFSTVVFAYERFYEGDDVSYNKPYKILNYKESSLFYGKLSDKYDVDFIKFNGKKGEELYFEVRVPSINGNNKFLPSVALISSKILQHDKVSFSIPENSGAILIRANESTREYKETYTGEKYILVNKIRGEIPEDGEYYVAIFNTNEGGKYSIKIGEKKIISLLETIGFPFAYLRLEFFLSPIKTIFKGLFIAIVIVGTVFIVKKRHRIFKKGHYNK